MAGGGVDPSTRASVAMRYEESMGARANLRRILSASLAGLRSSLDLTRYSDIRIEGYRMQDASGSPMIQIALMMPASSMMMHALRDGMPRLVNEDARRDAGGAEWLPLRHEDFLDIVESPSGGNDVEAWYGDLPDARSDGDGASTSRNDPAPAATWRSERIQLDAGSGRKIMTVRIDVDDLHDSKGVCTNSDDQIVGTALMRLYGSLVAVGMTEQDRAELDQGVTPLLAWKDDQRTVHIRFSAKGRFANAWATPQISISPAAAHVIIPDSSFVVRSGELATWHRMVLDALLPFRTEAPARSHSTLWTVTIALMVASAVTGRMLADVMGAPLSAAMAVIAIVVIGGVATLVANPSKDRPGDRPDTLDAVCIELRGIARTHLALAEAQRVGDAANGCLRFLKLAEGSTEQSVVDAAVLIRRHLPVLLQRYRDAVRLAQPEEIADHAARVCRGVVDLGTMADDVRLNMLKAAGDALDVELRYVRTRIADPTLSPIPDRIA
jgi:hypothetical protein